MTHIISGEAMASETRSVAEGRREAKNLCVETFSSEKGLDKRLFKNSNLTVKHEINTKKDKNKRLDGIIEIISFVSGNSFVETTRGILHLYKEK